MDHCTGAQGHNTVAQQESWVLRSWDDQDSVQEQAAGTETLVTTGAMGPATHQWDDNMQHFMWLLLTPPPPSLEVVLIRKMLMSPGWLYHVMRDVLLAWWLVWEWCSYMYSCNQNNILCHGTGVKYHNCHSQDQSLRIVSPSPPPPTMRNPRLVGVHNHNKGQQQWCRSYTIHSL